MGRITRLHLLGPADQNLAGAGGATRIHPGRNGRKSETTAGRARTGWDLNVPLWESRLLTVTTYSPVASGDRAVSHLHLIKEVWY